MFGLSVLGWCLGEHYGHVERADGYTGDRRVEFRKAVATLQAAEENRDGDTLRLFAIAESLCACSGDGFASSGGDGVANRTNAISG